MTSCKLNIVVFRLKWFFSILAKSSKSLIRFISIEELKSEFLSRHSHYFFSSFVKIRPPVLTTLKRFWAIEFYLTSLVFGRLIIMLEPN